MPNIVEQETLDDDGNIVRTDSGHDDYVPPDERDLTDTDENDPGDEGDGNNTNRNKLIIYASIGYFIAKEWKIL